MRPIVWILLLLNCAMAIICAILLDYTQATFHIAIAVLLVVTNMVYMMPPHE